MFLIDFGCCSPFERRCSLVISALFRAIRGHHCLINARDTHPVSGPSLRPRCRAREHRRESAVMGGQRINDVAAGAAAPSRQQRAVADLQLALNHYLTTGAATAGADTNLRPGRGPPLHIRLRRHLSVNRGLIHRQLDEQNDFWSRWMPSAVTFCLPAG